MSRTKGGFGQLQASPGRREGGGFSRDSSLDNLNPLLGQSARYHKSPQQHYNERTLNHKNSELFSQSSTTLIGDGDERQSAFGKRLYSSKGQNR